MSRVWLWCLLVLLAVLLGAAPAVAQYAPNKPDAGLEEMKYRAIYGRPPPPPAEGQVKKDDQAAQGQTTTTEAPKPRYRFEGDPLLNPPGSRPPEPVSPVSPSSEGAAPPSPYPQAPARPGGSGYSPRLPDGAAPSTGLPQRQIVVLVVDDQGRPVPLAQVSLSTRQRPFFREGLTDQRGSFTASVPCYVPGGESMLSHSLRVTGPAGSAERLLVTRQGACGVSDQVNVILADPNRLNRMMRRYQERQELYEQEDEEQKAKEEKEQEALPAKDKAQGKGKAAPGAKK